jgi:hypothetical protein
MDVLGSPYRSLLGNHQHLSLERRVRVASTGVAKQSLLIGCGASVVDLHAEPKGSTPQSRAKPAGIWTEANNWRRGSERSDPRSTREACWEAG